MSTSAGCGAGSANSQREKWRSTARHASLAGAGDTQSQTIYAIECAVETRQAVWLD